MVWWAGPGPAPIWVYWVHFYRWETFSDYLEHIEGLPHAIDFGANLAFSCVRAFVMGIENAGGVPTADEMREMKALVEEAMRDGAMGICASRSANHRAASDSGPGSKCRRHAAFSMLAKPKRLRSDRRPRARLLQQRRRAARDGEVGGVRAAG